MKSWLVPIVIVIELGALAGVRAEQGQADEASLMTREEWQAQLRRSRENANLMRQKARTSPPFQQPTLDELAKEATKRVLEDESLMPGDIVSTNHGLFRYRGSPDKERGASDFVRIR